MTRHPGRWHHDRDDAAWMMRNERMMRRSHAVLVTAAVVGLSLQPLRLLPRRLSPPAVEALPRRTSLGRLPAHWESTHHSRRKSTWVWAVPDVPVSAMSPVSWVATTRATPLPSSGSTASPAQLAHDTVGPASAPRRGSPASPEPRTEEEPPAGGFGDAAGSKGTRSTGRGPPRAHVPRAAWATLASCPGGPATEIGV
jgi:hypothetical protein